MNPYSIVVKRAEPHTALAEFILLAYCTGDSTIGQYNISIM
jgi:hypothetical protein